MTSEVKLITNTMEQSESRRLNIKHNTEEKEYGEKIWKGDDWKRGMRNEEHG